MMANLIYKEEHLAQLNLEKAFRNITQTDFSSSENAELTYRGMPSVRRLINSQTQLIDDVIQYRKRM